MDATIQLEIHALYSAYVAAIDDGRLEEWPDFFTDECSYRLVARENYERNLPLAMLSFESKGMLRDRVYSITSTLFHAPYYQRHVIGLPRVTGERDGLIGVEANYLVVRTRRHEPCDVLSAGRYIDTLVRQNGALKFREKLCVFDSELIPNSIIYPL